MSPETLEIFRQMSFASSVLAGFGIAVAIELIAFVKKGRLASAAIGLFLTSSVMTLTATFIFVFVMSSALGTEGSPKPSDEWIRHFMGGIGVFPFWGLALFMAGIGVVGWLHSKAIGILTSVSSALAFVLVIYVMYSLVNAG
jgi:hypothetical protein